MRPSLVKCKHNLPDNIEHIARTSTPSQGVGGTVKISSRQIEPRSFLNFWTGNIVQTSANSRHYTQYVQGSREKNHHNNRYIYEVTQKIATAQISSCGNAVDVTVLYCIMVLISSKQLKHPNYIKQVTKMSRKCAFQRPDDARKHSFVIITVFSLLACI